MLCDFMKRLNTTVIVLLVHISRISIFAEELAGKGSATIAISTLGG